MTGKFIGKRYRGSLAMILIAGVGLTMLAFGIARHSEAGHIRSELTHQCRQRALVVERAIEDHLEVLEAVNSFYRSSNEVDRDEFATFVIPFLERLRSIGYLAWVPKVADTDRLALEQQARRDGMENYQFLEKTGADAAIRAIPRDTYFPIYFLEPVIGNEKRVGMDLQSCPVDSKLIEEAIRTNRMVVVAPDCDMTDLHRDSNASLVAVLPVYRRDSFTFDEANRRQGLRGYLASGFDLPAMIEEAMKILEPIGIEFVLRGPSVSGDKVLYRHQMRLAEANTQTGTVPDDLQGIRTPVQVAGRQWEMESAASPAFVERNQTWIPQAILITGLIMSILFVLYMHSVFNRTAKVEAQVREKTADLQKSNTRLQKEIVDRQLAEVQLRKLTTAVQQSSSSIVITNLEGKIEYVNPKFCELTGYADSEAIGQNPRILKSGEMPSEAYKELWETISQGRVWRGEFHNKTKDGRLYWEYASISPVRDDEDRITHFIAIKEDITQRKEAEEQLRDTLKELEEANGQLEASTRLANEMAEEAKQADKAKSAFLANMSHEIRTPMNGVIGMIDLASDEELPDNARQCLGTARSSAETLLTIINDILDISKIESGKMKTEMIDCPLGQLLGDLYRLMAP